MRMSFYPFFFINQRGTNFIIIVCSRQTIDYKYALWTINDFIGTFWLFADFHLCHLRFCLYFSLCFYMAVLALLVIPALCSLFSYSFVLNSRPLIFFALFVSCLDSSYLLTPSYFSSCSALHVIDVLCRVFLFYSVTSPHLPLFLKNSLDSSHLILFYIF